MAALDRLCQVVLPVVMVLMCFTALASADSCPPFANAKSSCSSSTCGHFVYKGAFVEIEAKALRVPAAKEGIQLNAATSSPASCCNQCRQASGCAFWSYNAKTGLCSLFENGLCGEDVKSAYDPSAPDSYVGGMCIAAAPKETVPVFQDEVKLLDEKAFCLVSDKSLHINMLLGGYFDTRTAGSKTSRNGVTVRTWIRELAIMWKSKGKSHTLLLSARRGAEKERKEGYLNAITVDGTVVPRLTLGDELNLFDGEASVAFDAYEKMGAYDVDVYKIRIDGLMEAELRLRIAHPLLQLDSDAEVHMNMDILDLEYTDNVHGVLGQTYRTDRLDQALNYAVLSDLMNIANASEDVAGDKTVASMDGPALSYVSSDVTTPDCAHSRFGSAKVALGLQQVNAI